MYTIGLDIGYATIKIALLDEQNRVKYSKYLFHNGKIREILIKILKDIDEKFTLKNIKYGAVTGNGSRFLEKYRDIKKVNELATIVEAVTYLNRDIKSIIQIGGESAKYITNFAKEKKNLKFSFNSGCSAGTGSFLEEQASRLGIKLKDYSKLVEKAKSIPRIAGRCSVFAKSDITHRLQEGYKKEDILLGVCHSVIKNYKAIVMKRLPIELPLTIIGGVAKNRGMIMAIKEVLGINSNDLIIPKYFDRVESIGTALISQKEKSKIDLINLLDNLVEDKNKDSKKRSKYKKLEDYGVEELSDKHICAKFSKNKIEDIYLGVDIGSTSTNIVLMNKKKQILGYEYLKSFGNPQKTVIEGLNKINNKYGKLINLIGVGVTGSGRHMIGNLIGADIIRDEISAQSKAATNLYDDVDTIFEIGGQDSKFIQIENGNIKDFKMNKVCAAGTGSFIEEQAIKFNIPINDFGDISLKAENPAYLGSECTVFMENKISHHLSNGCKLDDIAAGLCYSIVNNYLQKVVADKKIGDKILLQGGIAYNKGIINAFKAITGKKIYVPNYFSITGAYGAALITMEEFHGVKSKFKGFNLTIDKNIEKIANLSIKNNINGIDKFLYDNFHNEPKKEEINLGIPNTLFFRGIIPMFGTFFKDLGINIVLSKETNDEIIELAQKHYNGETCFPIKVLYGHIAYLMEKGLDYIFIPNLHSMNKSISQSRKDYACVYLQSISDMVNSSFDFKNSKTKILSPTIGDFGKEYMMNLFLSLGKKLNKGFDEINNAIKKSIEYKSYFENMRNIKLKENISKIKKDEKILVIISKPYVILDNHLNMGIIEKLKDSPYKVIPFYDLPSADITKEHSNMYWPAGKSILGAAKLIKNHPNFYPILISNHCCGVDSVLLHYFIEIMEDKPYLIIESDEHSSNVGVITRIEAFLNSLKKKKTYWAKDLEYYIENIKESKKNMENDLDKLDKKIEYLIPNISPYSEILKNVLSKHDIKINIMSKTSDNSLKKGNSYSLGQELLSLQSIIGDYLTNLTSIDDKKSLLIPQSEGAEVNGQIGRLLRTKLDEEGLNKLNIFSPFIEDLIKNDEYLDDIFLAIMAGDIINNCNYKSRKRYLKAILNRINNENLTIINLKDFALQIYSELKLNYMDKKLFSIGDPLILFNNHLNDYTFTKLEEDGHKIVYAPLSEYLWLLWNDFNKYSGENKIVKENLNKYKKYITEISAILGDETPFEKDLDILIKNANKFNKHYSGGNGRYRAAKLYTDIDNLHGIITVSSRYENTDIVLDIKNRKDDNLYPIINLNYDGQENENNRLKLDSFLYYL